MDEVVLVNKNNEVLGYMEKLEAHKKGLLHRAFSVFIFNSDNELLLQKRSKIKYHSGGLWTNTCCSHPKKNESFFEAANKRLHEEMGMYCDLKEAFRFIYKSELDNDLIEHELDVVFIGFSDKKPIINKNEVEDFKYVSISQLQLDIKNDSDIFSKWIIICIDKVADALKNNTI